MEIMLLVDWESIAGLKRAVSVRTKFKMPTEKENRQKAKERMWDRMN